MLRTRALYVLRQIAEASEDGSQQARVTAYRQVDPLFRSVIRKRVARAVAKARLETQHAGDEAHVHRVAYLAEAGKAADNSNDVASVRAAFEAALASAEKRAPARWAPTIGLMAMIGVALAAAGAGWWASRPEPLRVELPVKRDAFVRGGKPSLGNSALEALFGEQLEHVARQLLSLSGEIEETERAALQKSLEREIAQLIVRAREVIDDDLASFLQAVLDQALAMASTEGAAAVDSFLRSIDALNSGLAVRGLGYYLDGEVVTDLYTGRSRVYLASFAVERVRFYKSSEDPIRVLHLARIDRIPFTRGVLGFTRPQVRDALVLLARVEGWFVSSITPALVEDKKLELVDARSRVAGEAWVSEVEHYAAGAVRAECERLTAAIGGYAPLAEAFARRRKLLADWKERYAGTLDVHDAQRYHLDPVDYFAVKSVVPAFEWRELEQIAEALESSEVKGIYRTLEQAQLSSIERHEAQHRLDYKHGVLERIPDELAQRVGPLEQFGLENVLARRALAELSAYLSELARGPDVVQLNLALFASHLLSRERWGTPECYAALVVFDGLARSMGIPTDPLVRGRFVARDQVAIVYKRLRSTPSEELSRSAKKLWEELFDRPLPELRLTSE